jgi:hypothetical protein
LTVRNIEITIIATTTAIPATLATPVAPATPTIATAIAAISPSSPSSSIHPYYILPNRSLAPPLHYLKSAALSTPFTLSN